MSIWYLVAIAIIAICSVILKIYLDEMTGPSGTESNASEPLRAAFQRKRYLFDSTSEFTLYKTLVQLFGDRYFIFPQINYNHFVESSKVKWLDKRLDANHIDRKSADFILCDKIQVVPQLVIELDGKVHQTSQKKRDRDALIDGIMGEIGMPILHLKNSDTDPAYIKQRVEEKLKK